MWLSAGILLGEYLVVTLLFDSHHLVHRGGIWLIVGSLSGLFPFVLVVGAALAMTRSGGPVDNQRVLPGTIDVNSPQVPQLLAHAALFAMFVFASWRVFGIQYANAAWLALWAGSGMAMTAFLVVALVPARRLMSQILLTPLLVGPLLRTLLLGTLAYLAGLMAMALWRPLGDLTIMTIVALMRPVFGEFTYDLQEHLLGLGNFAVQISPECSGYEGIGLAAVLWAGYLGLHRKQFIFPNALSLIPIAIALAWAGNVLRIIVLMIIGAYMSSEVAYGAFHTKAGWILFCVTTLGLAWWARRSPSFSRDTAPREEWINPTSPYLMPLLVVLGVSLVSTAFSENYAQYFGLQVVAGALVLYRYRYAYRQFKFSVGLTPVLLGIGVAILWLATAGEPKPFPVELRSTTIGTVLWLAIRCLGSVVIAPICEELAFRGFLLRRLQSKIFDAVPFHHFGILPLIVSSVLFGVLHGDRWLAATFAGAAYALVMRHRGRLSDAVLAHASTNGVIAIYSLWLKDWQHWAA